MKNDINEVETVDFEMEMNDKTYRKMQNDYDLLKAEMLYDDMLSDEEREELLDEVYFYKRILSVTANNDIPEKAIIGLFCLADILPELYDNKNKYIGESDTDTDLVEYVMEYGYRNFDRMVEKGDAVETYAKELLNYYHTYEVHGDDK